MFEESHRVALCRPISARAASAFLFGATGMQHSNAASSAPSANPRLPVNLSITLA